MLRHIVLLCHWLQNCKLGHDRRLRCAFAIACIAESVGSRREFMYTPPTPTRRDKTVSSRRRRRCVLGLTLTYPTLDSSLTYTCYAFAVPASPVAVCSEETTSSVTVTLRPAAGPVDSYTVEADCSAVTDADGNCREMSTGIDTTHVFSNLKPGTSYKFMVSATARNRPSAQVILTCRTLEG